jgi:putative ABC transport system permease protein
VRLALGARPGQVLAKVLGQGALVIAAGIALGLGGAVASSRALSALLYDIEPLDPATYIATSLLLAAIAVGAAWFPAQRASRVSPLIALKTE